MDAKENHGVCETPSPPLLDNEIPMSTEVASGTPEEPLRTDGDRSVRMKLATLVSIVITAGAAVAYAASVNNSLSAQSVKLEALVVRQLASETEARTTREILLEMRMNNRLMDQKLDYLTNGSQGRPPARTVTP